MLISLFGTWIQSVAQSWLVFELTGSAFLLGLVGFLNSIPIFLFSLLGGIMADRVSKKEIMIVTQTAFMLLAFILAVLTQLKLITPVQIMFIAFLNGLIMAFDAPSRQAMVVELVGKRHLPNAIALNSVAFNSSRMIGPALAGILVAAIGMNGCFYINGISFLAVLIALLFIQLPNNIRRTHQNSLFKDIKDALRIIGDNRLILILMTMVAVVSLFGVSYVILMPIFANDILKVGVRGLGVLMSSSGVGALIGALTLARLGDFKYKGRLLFVSTIVFSVSLVAFAISREYFLSLILLAICGWASVTAVSLVNTILQTAISDEYRGRVMSVFMLTFAGMMPFGNLLSGLFSQWFGVSYTVMISGLICLAFFLAINFFSPQLRKI